MTSPDERPGPRTDGRPPVLSRPLEEEIRNPFAPVDPPLALPMPVGAGVGSSGRPAPPPPVPRALLDGAVSLARPADAGVPGPVTPVALAKASTDVETTPATATTPATVTERQGHSLFPGGDREGRPSPLDAEVPLVSARGGSSTGRPAPAAPHAASAAPPAHSPPDDDTEDWVVPAAPGVTAPGPADPGVAVPAGWGPPPPTVPAAAPPDAYPAPGAYPQPDGGPPKPPTLARERRRIAEVLLACVPVVVLLAIAVGALLVGGGGGSDAPDAEVAETEPDHPAEWDPRIAPVAEWVADERDLDFTHPVEVELMPEAEYREMVGEDLTSGATDAEADAEAEDQLGVLRALGLVHGAVDLGAASGDLRGAGSLAHYDVVEEKVYVRGDELTPAVRVTLAHELTHVLQDQHFDLDRITDPDFDRAEGLRAMAEGDADRIDALYQEEELTGAEQDVYAEAMASDGAAAEEGVAEVPPALIALFSAPYVLGQSFLGFAEQVNGPGVYDDALEDPPSEAALMDPAAWRTAGAEEHAVDVSAPDDAEVLDEDTFGPAALFLVLASRGEPADALFVADAWGGDAYVSYRDGDATCVAIDVVGDDAAATDRIHQALVTWAAADPTGSATVTVDDEVHLQACDPGAGAAAVGSLSADVMAVPAVRAEIEASARASGVNDDGARCRADNVIATLSFEELTSDVVSADTQGRIVAAMSLCG